jgi:hypothetical protein
VKLRLSLRAERGELVGAPQGQQLLLQRGRELQGQVQVGMAGWKGDDVGADLSLDAELAKEVEMPSALLPVSAALPKRVPDQRDEPLESGCGPGVVLGRYLLRPPLLPRRRERFSGSPRTAA